MCTSEVSNESDLIIVNIIFDEMPCVNIKALKSKYIHVGLVLLYQFKVSKFTIIGGVPQVEKILS